MLNQYDVIHRMDKLLAEAGLKKNEVAEVTGLAAGYISEICSGKKDLNERIIQRVCEKFKGIEPYMFFIEPIDKEQNDIIKRLKALPESSQNEILKAIQFEEFKLINPAADSQASATLHEKKQDEYKEK